MNPGSTISATGAGAAGIVAQSAGNAESQQPIVIDISGTVEGGTAGGSGILISGGLNGGTNFAGTGETQNQVSITATGKVYTAAGINGWAVQAFDSINTIDNQGTLVGSVGLYAGGDSTTGLGGSGLINYGTFASGSVVDVNVVNNSGTLTPGGAGTIVTSHFGGELVQTGTGTLVVDIDATSGGQTADFVDVDEDITFQGGTIVPQATSLLPGNYPILSSSAASIVNLAQVPSSLLFSWDMTTTATDITLSPNPDFTPSGATLTSNESTLANYLQGTWQSGGSTEMAPVYGSLSRLQSGGDYKAALGNLSGQNVSVHYSGQTLATQAGLDAAFSCPVFVGSGTLLGERSCVWAKVEGDVIHSGARNGSSAYQQSAVTFRLGGQQEVAGDWFVGGNAAYTTSSANSDYDNSTTDGNRFDTSVSVKRVNGPWYVGLGANFGYGWYDNDRYVNLAGYGHRLSSDTNVLIAAGRLRVQYELPFRNWYLRPRADLGLIYTHIPSYSEDGPHGLALDVKDQNETTFTFSPHLEVGGRVDLSDSWTLRPYGGAGLLVLSNDNWSTEASLQGAPVGTGTFKIERDVPSLLGRFDLGVQIMRSDNLEARLEGHLQVGDSYVAGAGSLRVAFSF